jgi:hypothetical protein
VAGYNYAINEYRVEFPTNAGADLVCHGHYSFANIFEGNIVNTVMVDSTWGPTGPYTTFFRNRAVLYGFIMTSGASVLSDSLNFVGNESLLGIYFFSGINQFLYGNDSLGVIIPTGTDSLPDTSYYRSTFTDFFHPSPYPPTIGIPNTLDSGTIPAMQRYSSGGRITVSPNPPCIYSDIPTINSSEKLLIYPNPASNNFFVKMNNSSNARLDLFDLEGRILFSNSIPSGNRITEINTSDLSPGIYFLRMADDKDVVVKKIAIDK